jgi:hypothetical protein
MGMKKPCNAPCCSKEGKKLCGKCKMISYCDVLCQKSDWNAHKAICIEKLPEELIPFSQVLLFINKHSKLWMDTEMKKNTDQALQILKDLLSFAEHQYGETSSSTSPYRERPNGDRISNLTAGTYMNVC